MDVERNTAVVSITHTEPQVIKFKYFLKFYKKLFYYFKTGNALLAVYRCQAEIKRMEMRIRSIEGQFGTVKIYIVPRFVPIMCLVIEKILIFFICYF